MQKKKEKTNKILYKVTVNWYGELHTIYTHDYTEKRAIMNAAKQLQKRGVGYAIPYIFNKLTSDHSGVQTSINIEAKDET